MRSLGIGKCVKNQLRWAGWRQENLQKPVKCNALLSNEGL